MQASISNEKKPDLLEELQRLQSLPKCKKHHFLFLVGKLSVARKAIRAGRIFVKSLIDLSYKVKCMHHTMIGGWLSCHHGMVHLISLSLSQLMHLYTDASGSLGGVLIGPADGYNCSSQSTKTIMWKELFATDCFLSGAYALLLIVCYTCFLLAMYAVPYYTVHCIYYILSNKPTVRLV